jgi:hypothetical protein
MKLAAAPPKEASRHHQPGPYFASQSLGCHLNGLPRPLAAGGGYRLSDKINRRFIRGFAPARNTANLQQNSLHGGRSPNRPGRARGEEGRIGSLLWTELAPFTDRGIAGLLQCHYGKEVVVIRRALGACCAPPLIPTLNESSRMTRIRFPTAYLRSAPDHQCRTIVCSAAKAGRQFAGRRINNLVRLARTWSRHLRESARAVSRARGWPRRARPNRLFSRESREFATRP